MKPNRKQREALARAKSDITARDAGRTDIDYTTDELPTEHIGMRVTHAPPVQTSEGHPLTATVSGEGFYTTVPVMVIDGMVHVPQVIIPLEK